MRTLRFRLALAAVLIATAPFAWADVTVTTAAEFATALATPGNTLVLGNDIDLTGWTTVDGFSGTINGQGYKLLTSTPRSSAPSPATSTSATSS